MDWISFTIGALTSAVVLLAILCPLLTKFLVDSTGLLEKNIESVNRLIDFVERKSGDE